MTQEDKSGDIGLFGRAGWLTCGDLEKINILGSSVIRGPFLRVLIVMICTRWEQ
jgi:hypothetical protein